MSNFCVICYTPIEDTSSKVVLSCRHNFHVSCSINGLRSGYTNCPVCVELKSKDEINDGREPAPIDFGNNSRAEDLIGRRKALTNYFNLFMKTDEISKFEIPKMLEKKEQLEKEDLQSDNSNREKEKWYTPIKEILSIVTTKEEPKSAHFITHKDAIQLIKNSVPVSELHNIYAIDIYSLLTKEGHGLRIGLFFDNGYNLADLVLLGTTYVDFFELMKNEKNTGFSTPWGKYKDFLDLDYIMEVWKVNILDIFEKVCNNRMSKFASIGFTIIELKKLCKGVRNSVSQVLIELMSMEKRHLAKFKFTEVEWALELGLTRENLKKDLDIDEIFLTNELKWEYDTDAFRKLYPKKEEIIVQTVQIKSKKKPKSKRHE